MRKRILPSADGKPRLSPVLIVAIGLIGWCMVCTFDVRPAGAEKVVLFHDAGAIANSNSTVAMRLDRAICGQCCIEKIRAGVGAAPGVQGLNIDVGSSFMTVRFDGAVTNPELLEQELKLSGFTASRMSLADLPPRRSKQWVKTR